MAGAVWLYDLRPTGRGQAAPSVTNAECFCCIRWVLLIAISPRRVEIQSIIPFTCLALLVVHSVETHRGGAITHHLDHHLETSGLDFVSAGRGLLKWAPRDPTFILLFDSSTKAKAVYGTDPVGSTLSHACCIYRFSTSSHPSPNRAPRWITLWQGKAVSALALI